MATAAKSGFGTLLKMGDGASPEVFTTIAEVTNITGPSVVGGTIDMTSMDSSNNAREFLGSLLVDWGEVSFSINYHPKAATAISFLAAVAANVSKNWTLTFTTSPASSFAFAGIPTGFTPTMPLDDKMSAECTIKVSGKPSTLPS